jgi:hypothetical protein
MILAASGEPDDISSTLKKYKRPIAASSITLNAELGDAEGYFERDRCEDFSAPTNLNHIRLPLNSIKGEGVKRPLVNVSPLYIADDDSLIFNKGERARS